MFLDQPGNEEDNNNKILEITYESSVLQLNNISVTRREPETIAPIIRPPSSIIVEHPHPSSVQQHVAPDVDIIAETDTINAPPRPADVFEPQVGAGVEVRLSFTYAYAQDLHYTAVYLTITIYISSAFIVLSSPPPATGTS